MNILSSKVKIQSSPIYLLAVEGQEVDLGLMAVSGFLDQLV